MVLIWLNSLQRRRDYPAFCLISKLLKYTVRKDENGSIVNSTLAEKIYDVEMYFQVLCGFGTDEFTEEKARTNLLSSIDKLDMIVSDEGLDLSSQRQI